MKAVSGLFGGSEPTIIQAPEIKPPPVMPTPNDAATKAAKRRALVTQYSRRGRQSTILSDALSGSDALGG